MPFILILIFLSVLDGRSLNSTIQEKLYERLLSLPRVMKSANDEDKLIHLNILLGYFNLFGDRLADVLHSLSVLEKLLKSFVQVQYKLMFVQLHI